MASRQPAKFVIADWGEWKIVKPSSSMPIDDIQALLASGEVQGVGITSAHGFERGGSIQFLESLEGLQGIVVQDPKSDQIDLTVVAKMEHLKFLAIGEHRQETDLTGLSELRHLRVTLGGKDKLPSVRNSRLDHLTLGFPKFLSGDLTMLEPYPVLTSIHLSGGTIESLKGIDRFSQLMKVDLAYCRRLHDISGLERSTVQELYLDVCRRVVDYTPLKACRYLRMLCVCRGSPVASLEFLRELKALRDFRLVETDVLDGDLSVLVDLPLKQISLTDKRRFSHTEKQIAEQIQRRDAQR